MKALSEMATVMRSLFGEAMKCSQCNRRGSSNRSRCLYCGGELVSDKTSGPIQCCGCQSEMVEVEHHGVLIDVCSGCDSIWFDNGELEAILERPPHSDQHVSEGGSSNQRFEGVASTESTQSGVRSCPHCAKSMGQLNYKHLSGVIVDVCRFHGVFLDHLELEKLQEFAATGGLAQAKKRIKQEETQQEKRQLESKTRRRLQATRNVRRGPNFGTLHAERVRYGNWAGDVFAFLKKHW